MVSTEYIYDEVKKAGLTAHMLAFENHEKVVRQNIFLHFWILKKQNFLVHKLL